MQTIAEEMRATVNLVEAINPAEYEEYDEEAAEQKAQEYFEPEYREFLTRLADFTNQGSGMRGSTDSQAIEIFEKYKSPLYARDGMKLYRGVSLEKWEDIDAEFDFRNKKTLVCPYFLSTSYDKGVAEHDYLSANSDRHSVFLLFEIIPTFYAPSIVVDYYAEDLDLLKDLFPEKESIHWNPNDHEVLLAPASFRVTGYGQKECKFKKQCEYWTINLEMVG